MPEWLLVDGSSIIFRAFYGVPQTNRGPDGKLINAIRGFLDTLARRVDERKPRHVAVTTDEDWRPDWRVEQPQIPVIMDSLAAVGVDVVGLDDYEAEDIIASLATKVELPIEILSGDRDLFSQIRAREIVVLYPEKTGLAVVDEEEVARRYGIPGGSYSDYAILRGDPSDGLPGLAGVGDKKAADLVRRYGSIQGMLDAKIFRSADTEYLERAQRVVPPVRDLKIKVPRGRRDRYPEHPRKVEELGTRYGVGGSLKRLSEALSKMPK